MTIRESYLTPVLALVGLVAVLALLTVAYFLFKETKLAQVLRPLTWEECTNDPRGQILESYPARCSIPGIGTVIQPLSDEERRQLQPPNSQQSSAKP